MTDTTLDLSMFERQPTDETTLQQQAQGVVSQGSMTPDAPLDLSMFERQPEASSVLSEASRVNPDQQAKINQISKDTGIPAIDVEVDPTGIAADHNARKLASEDLSKNPKTSEFLKNFDNAAVSHDDVPILKKIENALRNLTEFTADTEVITETDRLGGDTFKGSGRNIKLNAEKSGYALIDNLTKLLFVKGEYDTEADHESSFKDEYNRINTEIATNTPSNLTWVQKSARGALESAPVTAAALGSIIVTKQPLAGASLGGVYTYGDSYAEGVNSGLNDAQATRYAAINGIIETGMEVLPDKLLVGMLDGAGLKKKIMKYLATEVASEQATTLAQSTTTILTGIDEEWNNAKTPEEKLQLQLERQVITLGSTLILGTAQGSIASTIGKVTNANKEYNDAQAQQSSLEQVTLDELNDAATESKLNSRAKDTFSQFVQTADGDNNTHVFIDGVQAKLYLDTVKDKQSPAAILLTDKVNDAAALGVDVEIPVADFATSIAGTEHFEALRPFMTMSAGSTSPFRQEQAQTETTDYLKSLVDRASDNVSQYVESQQIFDTVKQQLIDTGRVSTQNADTMSRIVPAWATVFAADNGITVKEAYENSGLMITGPETGVKSTLQEDAFLVDNNLIRETDSEKFGKLISDAKASRPGEGALVHQYTPEEYAAMKTYTTPNGDVGFAIKDDGDIVSVFKHGGSIKKGALDHIIPMAIALGGRKLDAFEGFLTKSYAKHGFKEVGRMPWDDKYAPENWDYEKFGKPDVVMMELDPEKLNQELTRLEGAPESANVPGRGRVELGIYQPAVDAAKRYMESVGLPYQPLTKYVKVDEALAKRIADAYEAMPHDPQNTEVKAAYDAMINETVAQYEEILKTGLKVEFIKGSDPYTGGPYEAVLDVVENNHLWVYPTRSGFGTDATFDPKDNPLLAETTFKISGEVALANDIFRVVHDYFGHVKNGVGFRATGEENAWQAHASMYSPLARRAMTTETRGQNSWLNYGPHGEKNRTAKTEDTVFADQKTGLLPLWVSETNRQSAEVLHQVIGMHSALERAAETLQIPAWKKEGASANGSDIWAKIKSMPNVKTEELQWVGVEDFLTGSSKPLKFTRDEVLNFIKQNGVKVEEILAGGEDTTQFNDDKWTEHDEVIITPIDFNTDTNEWEDGELDTTVYEHATGIRIRQVYDEYILNDPDGNEVSTHVGWERAKSAARRLAERLELIDTGAKWEEYVTPGGHTNYREYKLTLPQIKDKYVKESHFEDENIVTWMRVDDRSLSTGGEVPSVAVQYSVKVVPNPVKNAMVGHVLQITDGDEIISAIGVNVNDDQTEALFKRHIERYITEGENGDDYIPSFGRFKKGYMIQDGKLVKQETQKNSKTFFIDEMQSDWHQDGRQRGYQRGHDIFELRKEYDALSAKIDEKINSLFDKLQPLSPFEFSTDNFAEPQIKASHGGNYFDFYNKREFRNGVSQYVINSKKFQERVTSETFNYFKSIAESPDLDSKELRTMSDEMDRIDDQIDAELSGVPDAPFKDDAWMTMGLKRALILAAEGGYDSIAWPNAEVMMQRWSTESENLYRNQYEKKMPSIVKKLTGETPIHVGLKTGQAAKPVDELGYFIIPIKPSLRQQISTNSFSLFQQSRGYYEPGNSMIRLTESSDLSTFLHEFAHFMYEMEIKSNGKKLNGISAWFKRNADEVAKEANDVIAKQPVDFTQSPVVVSAADVSIYLDNKTTGDVKKDSAIRIATHEQFARGFETYLMEGVAPSVELRNVFRTFARWLTQIYKAIKGNLKVRLDDDMRKVFDTLLATEEQIAMAEARARYSPMFTDAAMAGMSDSDFEKYKENQVKVKDVATETLRDKLIAELTRAKKQWWKDEKSDLIDIELDALKSQKVYRAIDALRNGEMKLDHAAVKATWGYQRTDARGIESTRIPEALSNMTVKGAQGIMPDDAAAFLGYDSGAELIDAITNATPIKAAAAARAEAIMLERHGDMLNDGTIQKEADEAVQNEARGRLILQELKVLSKGTRTIERDAIKALAEESIGKLNYRQIHPGKYRKAEIRAAAESASMFEKGNVEGATAAKARQVMNYYLGMAATDAQNNITKIIDRMARYNKKDVREEILKAEGGYWEQIVKILERFEFRKSATLTMVDQVNQDINTWAKERMEVDGDSLVLSPIVLNELYRTHWKNIAYSDLQGVNDSVKNIEHVARYSNKMTRMGEEVDFKKLVNKWVDHMSNMPTRFTAQRTDVVEGRNWGRWAMAQMTKIPYLASWLDGGERVGLSHQILVQPVTEAYNAKNALLNSIGKDVLSMIENRSAEDLKRHNTKLFIPEIKDAVNNGNLMGHQVIAVALNTGNAGNLRKMLLGEGWANPDNENEINFGNPKLQAVLKHMTKSDWDLVQSIWDKMELLYPQLAEVHRKTTGLVPPKIDATPIVTAHGTFKGGYYPMKYDPNRSHKAELNEERANAQVESMFSTVGSIQASVNASATNERTKYYAPVRLSLDVVPNHFEEVIHFITHHDTVREINKLLRDKSVAETIKSKLGPEEFAQLKPWLNDIAKDGRDTPTKNFIDKMLQQLRMGTTLGVMGFKATTGILQIAGLSNSIAEVGIAPMAQSLRTILGSTKNMKESWDFANANSKVLNHRANSMDREIRNVFNKAQGKSGNLAALQNVSMKHIALIQTYMVDLPTWYAAYIKSMKEFGDEQKAYQYGDWCVENLQGSGLTKDMASLYRNQNEAMRILTMFMTYFSSLWNMERDIVKGAKAGKYSTTDVAAKALFLFTIPVLFEMFLRGEFGGDDDEEAVLQKMILKLAVAPVQSIPFVRGMADGVTGDYGYNISPVASLIGKGLEGTKGVGESLWNGTEMSEHDMKNMSKLIGASLGIPGTGQAWNSGEHIYDVLITGEDLTFRELVIGPVKK